MTSADARDAAARLSPLARVEGLVRAAIPWLTRHKRPVGASVLLVIAGFLAAAVWKSWSQLAHYQWQVRWGLLLVAFSLFAAQELSFALIWRGILARLGSRLSVLESERIYLGAEFVRYIPGNVLHVITRVLWAERRGVPKARGFASMVIELATKLASAALVFAFTLLFWPDARALAARLPRGALLTMGALGVPLLLVGLHPRLLRALLNGGLRRLKRNPVEMSLTYADVLTITAYWAASWIVAGVGFYLLIRSLVAAPAPGAAPLLAIGIFAIGWDVGFLSFVTPSGLGVREAVIAALLVAAGLAPPAVAVVIALIARLLTTGAELACISGAYLAPGRVERPPVPPEGSREPPKEA
ncbi:MAG: flippase-like domain-containing protein [Ktedonobacterales bacterium]|nr:flippase-like domain-containing protein [Ktedonobacterales bacterium]